MSINRWKLTLACKLYGLNPAKWQQHSLITRGLWKLPSIFTQLKIMQKARKSGRDLTAVRDQWVVPRYKNIIPAVTKNTLDGFELTSLQSNLIIPEIREFHRRKLIPHTVVRTCSHYAVTPNVPQASARTIWNGTPRTCDLWSNVYTGRVPFDQKFRLTFPNFHMSNGTVFSTTPDRSRSIPAWAHFSPQNAEGWWKSSCFKRHKLLHEKKI